MQISEHSVRERAYYIWEDEGRVHGRATAHWLRAETELHAVAAPVASKAEPAKAATKAKAAKPAAAKPVTAKTATGKTVVAKAVVAKAIAAKPVAAKVAKAPKAAVTAGLAAKTKAPRAPIAMH